MHHSDEIALNLVKQLDQAFADNPHDVLLDEKAAVDQSDNKGNYPIHYAAYRASSTEIGEYLEGDEILKS